MAEDKTMDEAQFRYELKKWCDIVRAQAKQNAASFTKGKSKSHTYIKGRYAGKTEYKLKDKVGYAMRKRNGDIDYVSFKIPVHGIFREYGVGNGQPRNGAYSSTKKAQKTYIKRSMNDWIHNPIEKNIERFSDLVADYYSDQMMVNFRKLKEK